MDNLGDIFYLILVVVISVAGVLSKKKEKRAKKNKTAEQKSVPEPETASVFETEDEEETDESGKLFEDEIVKTEQQGEMTEHKPVFDNWMGGLRDIMQEVQESAKEKKNRTESDVLMEQMHQKMKEEENERRELERKELQEVADKLNQPVEKSGVQQKREEQKRMELNETADEKECGSGSVFDVDLMDAEEARKAFIASEIFNKRY